MAKSKPSVKEYNEQRRAENQKKIQERKSRINEKVKASKERRQERLKVIEEARSRRKKPDTTWSEQKEARTKR